jgi:hypothetical protein
VRTSPVTLSAQAPRGSPANKTKSGREPPPVGSRQQHFPPMPCRRCGDMRQGAKHNNDLPGVSFLAET